MKMFHMVTYSLAIVGALNWGLVGLGMLLGGPMADWNLVHMLLGGMPTVEQLVYVLVGASAVYDFAMHMGYCKICSSKKK